MDESEDADGAPVDADGAAGDAEAAAGSADGAAEDPDESREDRKCDYCRLPIPEAPVTADHEGVTYHFCSAPCRETLLAEDRVFTEYHGGRRFDPGVSALRAGLPQGMPRNAVVLVSGQPGTRTEALHAEVVWRALQRGEPAVLVAFLDTPVSVVQEFVALGWNVLPYLASGQLRLLDCFSYRLDDPEGMTESMSDWNRHLHRVAAGSTTNIRDPSNPQAVLNGVEGCVDAATDVDAEEGVVVIDSLTEFGSLVQPVQGYDFVKDLRAAVAKSRGVPVFAGASRIDSGDAFPHDLGYIADGVIDLALSDDVVEDALMKRIRVRKMTGVFAIRRWVTYEFAEGRGLVATDSGDDAAESGEADDEAADDCAADVEAAAAGDDTTDEIEPASGDAPDGAAGPPGADTGADGGER
ncbi:recombinase RecA [Halobacteriales archaeon QS_1_69_70]|nr:MAG: recombinase RecA [Halobacteriales archaeon QS_1_69_70]